MPPPGAQGQWSQQPPPAPPPGAQGQWPQQPPQGAQGQWPQQPPQGAQGQWPQPHGMAPPQQGMVPSPQPYPAAPGAPAMVPHMGPNPSMLRPYPLIMQRGITRLTGHMFLAPTRLFFICQSQKGGLAVALGRGVGGLVGGALAALAAPVPGQAAPVFDEPTLFRTVQEAPGSLAMEAAQIKQIKHTMWWRGIWFAGQTYGLPNGLAKDLKHELGLWCQANNVKSAGLT